MEAVLGRMLSSLLERSKDRSRFFNTDGIVLGPYSRALEHEKLTCDLGNLLTPSTFPPFPLGRICQNPQLSASEKTLFLDFIGSMVNLEPEKRPRARELLKAPWLKAE